MESRCTVHDSMVFYHILGLIWDFVNKKVLVGLGGDLREQKKRWWAGLWASLDGDLLQSLHNIMISCASGHYNLNISKN